MAAIDDLRVATQAALTALEADAGSLTATQQAAIDAQQAEITAEAAAPGAANKRVQESAASGVRNQSRTGTDLVPVITSSLAQLNLTKNVAMSTYTVTATQTPTAFAASPLPAGLVINGSTGAITGTPTVDSVNNNNNAAYRVYLTATKSGKTSQPAVKLIFIAP